MFTIDQITKKNETKQYWCKIMSKQWGFEFDYSLPQDWLNNFVNSTGMDYSLVRSTTVWAYPESIPVSFCIEMQAVIDRYVAS